MLPGGYGTHRQVYHVDAEGITRCTWWRPNIQQDVLPMNAEDMTTSPPSVEPGEYDTSTRWVPKIWSQIYLQ